MTLKMGVSGVRGILGDSLTYDVARDLAKAFATYIGKGTVIVGRDTRPSGKSLEKLMIMNLLDLGINVVMAGISATPTMQVLVRSLKADGAIVITASHNPIEWNGFKFISRSGIFLTPKQNEELFDIYEKKAFKKASKAGKVTILKNGDKYHIQKVLKAVDVAAIRKKKFKVVIDSCNGAGSLITPVLLEKLGCKAIHIYTDPNSPFPRGTEPTADNITALKEAVIKHKADIGFAQDPDADRLAIVDEKGNAIGEEYTMVLAGKYVLSRSKKGSKVVTNLSTSMMIDSVAKSYGAKVIRTKVGEINVVEGLIKNKGVFAGEGNGGVIYPKVITSRDSLTGIALVLSLLAEEGKKVSEVIRGIPSYVMLKTKIPCQGLKEVEALLERTKTVFKNARLNKIDGIRADMDGEWIHVRASNTEPIVRIIVEAATLNAANKLVGRISA